MRSTSKAKFVFALVGKQVIGWLLVGIVAALLLSAVEIAIAMCMQQILVSMGSAEIASASNLPSLFTVQATVPSLIIAFAILGGFRALLSFLMSWSAAASEKMTLAKLRQLELTEMLTGKERSTVAPSQIQFAMETIFPRAALYVSLFSGLVSQIVLASGIIIAIGMLSWALCFIAVSAVIAIGVAVRKIGEIVNYQSTQQLRPMSDFLSGVGRVARNWFFVRVMKAKAGEYHRLSELNTRATSLAMRAQLGVCAAQAFPQFAGIVLLSALMAIQHHYDIGGSAMFLQFVYLLMRLVQILTGIAGVFGALNLYRAGLRETLRWFKDTPENQMMRSHATLKQLQNGTAIRSSDESLSTDSSTQHDAVALLPDVQVRNLSFSYDAAIEVFHSINMDVRPGEQLGIIGPSGSGKSTLMSLILGLQQPTRGEILINGKPPSRFLEEEQSIVGYVGAEAFLVEGTIKDNLDYGRRREYIDSDYITAIQQSRLGSLIKRISLGLNHPISENGEGLSAGEKQRLSLARALLRRPRLLILDEVTANLDSETELEIAESLRELKGSCTCLIVSHRPGILKHSDRVYDLEKKTWAPMLKDLLREVI